MSDLGEATGTSASFGAAARPLGLATRTAPDADAHVSDNVSSTPGIATAAAAVRAGNAHARNADVPFLAVLGRLRAGDVTGEAAGALGSAGWRGSGERDAKLARPASLRSTAAASGAGARPPSLGVAMTAVVAAAPNENESLAAAPRRPPRGYAGPGGGARLFLEAPPRDARFGAVSSSSASVEKVASAMAHAAKPGSCGRARARQQQL